MVNTINLQPAWTCYDCGIKYGKRPMSNHAATYHEGRCEVCKEAKAVTEPRDYGYLNQKWHNHSQS